MATLNGIITGYIVGDDIDVTRSVPGIPSSQTLSLAWMTVKTNVGDADPGLLQKAITPSAVAGTGQITDTGAGSGTLPVGTGSVLFQLTAANTLALSSGVNLHYDIKVKTSAGKIYTAEQGVLTLTPRITTATS